MEKLKRKREERKDVGKGRNTYSKVRKMKRENHMWEGEKRVKNRSKEAERRIGNEKKIERNI